MKPNCNYTVWCSTNDSLHKSTEWMFKVGGKNMKVVITFFTLLQIYVDIKESILQEQNACNVTLKIEFWLQIFIRFLMCH
jgi:hypothetical protein